MNRAGDGEFLLDDIAFMRKPSAVHPNKFIDGLQIGFGIIIGGAIASAIVGVIVVALLLLFGIMLP